MTAGAYNFICEQGATFARTIYVRDSADALRDLSSYSGRMQVRRRVTETTTLVELTTDNGKMTLTENGEIFLNLTPTETSAIAESGFYDIELEDGSGNVERLIEGSFTLVPEVTR